MISKQKSMVNDGNSKTEINRKNLEQVKKLHDLAPSVARGKTRKNEAK